MRKIIGFLCCLLVVVALGKTLFNDTAPAETTAEKTALLTSQADIPTDTETSLATQTKVQTIVDDATLYAKQSFSSTVLATVNKGELLTLVGEANDWYQVAADGETGYLAKQDCELLTYQSKTPATSLEDAVILLDAGHGGEDVGALSNDENYYEKDLTLETVLTVQAALEAAGCTVLLTRDSDQFLSLDEISELSNSQAIDLFLSFHYDASPNPNEATGTTVYYYYQENQDLAETVADSLTSLPLENRGVEYGNLSVLRENAQPALLLELGYLNTDYDLAQITSTSYQAAAADAITEALRTYFATRSE